MKKYEQKVELSFKLKGTPSSSRESYWGRMCAFLTFMEALDRLIEDMNEEDIPF